MPLGVSSVIGKFQYVGGVAGDTVNNTMTVSGLDLDADGVYFIRCCNNLDGKVMGWYANADNAAANYYIQYISGSAAVVSAARANSYGLTDRIGIFEAFLSRPTGGKARMLINNGQYTGANLVAQIRAWEWQTASNITSITALNTTDATAYDAVSYLKVWKVIS